MSPGDIYYLPIYKNPPSIPNNEKMCKLHGMFGWEMKGVRVVVVELSFNNNSSENVILRVS